MGVMPAEELREGCPAIVSIRSAVSWDRLGGGDGWRNRGLRKVLECEGPKCCCQERGGPSRDVVIGRAGACKNVEATEAPKR